MPCLKKLDVFLKVTGDLWVFRQVHGMVLIVLLIAKY